MKAMAKKAPKKRKQVIIYTGINKQKEEENQEEKQPNGQEQPQAKKDPKSKRMITEPVEEEPVELTEDEKIKKYIRSKLKSLLIAVSFTKRLPKNFRKNQIIRLASKKSTTLVETSQFYAVMTLPFILDLSLLWNETGLHVRNAIGSEANPRPDFP